MKYSDLATPEQVKTGPGGAMPGAGTGSHAPGAGPVTPADKALTGGGQPSPAPAAKDEDSFSKYLRRTPGLKLYDVFLYPILTNAVVFGMSVGATYLTSRGGDRNAAGKLVYGKFGKFFHDRGEWMIRKFKGMGMTDGQADMSKMVFFSFADGTLIAPMVKLLEDRREKIAHGIDKSLGTVPEDQSVYEAEPKQTWGSVIGGRLLTCMIVVPTAVVMEKTGMNNLLFHGASRRVSNYISRNPGVARKVQRVFGETVDIPEISKVGVFEAFYTSVCTAGLYTISRMIADVKEKLGTKPKNEYEHPKTGAHPQAQHEQHATSSGETQQEPPHSFAESVVRNQPIAAARSMMDFAAHNVVMERS